MTVMTGLLDAWRQLKVPADFVICASRTPVIQALRNVYPQAEIITFPMVTGPAFFLQRRRMAKHIANIQPDVILTTNFMLPIGNIPQVVHHQNLKHFRRSAGWGDLLKNGLREAARDRAAQRAARYAACNTYISRYLMLEAERLVPPSRGRNHVVYNGVSNQMIDLAHALTTIGNPPHHLISISAPSEHKDNPTLIRAFARLIKLDPQGQWQLSIAGAGDWSIYHPLINKLNVQNRIRFPGFLSLEQIQPLLHQASAMVFTSYLEGFGLPVLEAMACHCPVIACRATALPEVVGQAGILVEPGDSEGFAQAIFRLAQDSIMRHRLIETGIKHIQEFSWQRSAAILFDLLRKTAGQ